MTEPENQNSNADIENILSEDEEGVDLSNQLNEADESEASETSDESELVEPILQEEQETVEPSESESAESELEKYKDIAARSQADLENYRKRMAREKTEAIQYANYSLLSSLLPVIDNFEMGLKAAKNEDENSVIYQGMVMVQKQIVDFLSENRVEQIQVEEGADFDPNLHEAIKQEPSETVEEGKIVFVMRNGYRLKDRLLRPANVVVSKGASETEKDTETSPTE